MPDRNDLKASMASAQRQAAGADAAVAAASAATLTGLMKRDIGERFDALADPGLDLTQEDRRRLVKSLKGGKSSRRVMTAATASRWARMRSRLPYRKRAVALFGCGMLGAVVVVAMAYRHTPVGWVRTGLPQDVAAEFVRPDGSTVSDRLTSGEAYMLLRQTGDMSVLRAWLPKVGYAETTVPSAWLQRAP